MKITAYIDGQEGTTGLQIRDRLLKHPQAELLEIDPGKRKDPAERARLMNESQVTFLCLPDDAAREAVTWAVNPATKVIDASTAHRTAQGWAYGFPELSKEHRSAVAHGKRIANPGCHATGFLVSAYPLVKLGICGRDYPFTCHSVTGYSGGGKKMIAQYRDPARSADLGSPRQYALSQSHKHLPEMQKVPGLAYPPVFNPIVADFSCGMAVSTPLIARLLQKKLSKDELTKALADYYEGCALIRVSAPPQSGFLPAGEKANLPGLTLYVCGNDEEMTLISLFDNLGKGASGAAVQNMNIAFGLPETESLWEE